MKIITNYKTTILVLLMVFSKTIFSQCAAPIAHVNSPVCQGDSITLTVDSVAGATFFWAGPNGFSTIIQNPIILGATNSNIGWYKVYYVLGNCTSVKDSVYVTVNPAPSAIAGPTQTLCFGQTTTLGSSLNPLNYTYSWTSSPVGFTSNSPNPVTISQIGSTTYFLTVTDPATGCTSHDSVLVIVNPVPIAFAGADQTICLGDSVHLGSSANTNANVYNWSSNPVGFFSNLPQPWVTPLVTTSYYMTAANPQTNCFFQDTVTITVLPLPPTPTCSAITPICQGQTIQLFGNSNLNGAIYAWTGPNGFSSAQQNPTIPFSTMADSGKYYLKVFNGACYSLPDSVNVVINPAPTPITANSQNLCLGNSIALGGPAQPNITYSWTSNPAGFTSTIANPTVSPVVTTNYILVVTNSITGCTALITITITVVPVPAAPTVSVNSPVCSGDTIFLNASSNQNGNYTWSGPNGYSSNLQNPSILNSTLGMAGTYSATITVNGCPSLSSSTNLVVNQSPNALVGNPQTICPGATVNLGAPPVNGDTYSWVSNPNGFNSNISNPTASPIVTTTYSLTETNSVTGCSTTHSVVITVTPVPLAAFTTDSIWCLNSIDSLVNQTIGNNLTFTWNFGDGFITNQNNPHHSYNTIGTDTITLTVHTQAGCTDSIKKIISVSEPAVPSFTMSANTGCDSVLVTFTNTSTGQQITQYSWNFGNNTTSLSQNPNPVMFYPGVIGDTVYYITLTITNHCGITTYIDSVHVQSKPHANFGTSALVGCSPMTITFSNTTTGNPTSYFWILGNGNTSTLSNPGSQTYIAGNLDSIYTITLIATNSCGSDTIHRTIQVNPNSITAFFNTTITSGCSPLTVTFDDFSFGATVVNWEFGDGNVSNLINPTHTYTNPGTYIVHDCVNNGCSYDTATTIITVFPSPVVAFTASQDTVCLGVPIAFNNQSVNLSSNTWSFGNGDSSILTNPVYTYPNAGTYTVILVGTSSSNQCTSSDTLVVTVLNKPTVVFTPSDTVGCQPLEIVFTDNTTNANFYSWTFGDGNVSTQFNPTNIFTQAGTFTSKLVAISANGCMDSADVNIVVHIKPTNAFTLSETATCGFPATINITNNTVNANNYAWDFGDGQTSNATNPSVTYNSNNAFTITLISSTAFGCADTTNSVFTIYPQPIANFTYNPAVGCAPDPVNFINHSTNGGSYVWYFGDSSTSNQSDPLHIYNFAGTYSVKMIVYGEQGGCADSISMNNIITVHPSPVAGFNYTAITNPVANGNIDFVNTSTGATSYAWSFGDGSEDNSADIIHHYDTFGYYNVILVAMNNFGCTDTVQKLIDVPFFGGLFVPNAISPSSGPEGVRVFLPKGKGLQEYDLKIFNRWGVQVFETTALDEKGSPTEGWDGTYKGVPCQQDTYVWKIYASFKDGNVWRGEGANNPTTSGNIALIR